MPKPAAPAASNDPCSDLSGLTEAEAGMRTTFKYVTHSTEEGKNCTNCQLYVVPEEGKSCGGCTIIKGPINPEGYCMQWIAKQG